MILRGAPILSVGWLILITIVAVGAPVLAPLDPQQPLGPPLSYPAQASFLGTDSLGRDLLSRLIFGTRFSLSIALLASAITISVGTLFGLTAAVFPGLFDRIMLWASNTLLAIPGLLLAMLVVARTGTGLASVVFAIGIGGIPGFLRLSRALFIQIRSQAFISSAVALGGSKLWIARFHILPNAGPRYISISTIHIAWAFLGATSLTFLGFAGDPSIPEWGSMLNTGRSFLNQAPHLAILPGFAISATIMAIQSLGRWISHISDPLDAGWRSSQSGNRNR
ncbi:MAG: ABC transporter permease [Chloroflexi bacterium]|nr:ABC transporter permease [Chloroflexota bacterium]